MATVSGDVYFYQLLHGAGTPWGLQLFGPVSDLLILGVGNMLTKRDVDGLECPYGEDSKRRFVMYDDEGIGKGKGAIPGFGCRCYPSGRKVFVLRYRRGGRSRLLTLGDFGSTYTVQEARDAAREARVKLAKGVDPLQERREREEQARRERERRKTVAELADEYMADADVKESTRRSYRQLLDAHILPRFGKREAASVTDSDVRRFKNAMSDAPYAFNRAAWLLGALLEKGGVSERDNPLRGARSSRVPRYREKKRRRYLTGAEVARLGDALRRLEGDGVHIESEGHRVRGPRLHRLPACRGRYPHARHDGRSRRRGVEPAMG